MPKPVKSVNITAADGKTQITFLPDDIRALACLYWANGEFATKFIGNRCRYTDLKQFPNMKNWSI